MSSGGRYARAETGGPVPLFELTSTGSVVHLTSSGAGGCDWLDLPAVCVAACCQNLRQVSPSAVFFEAGPVLPAVMLPPGWAERAWLGVVWWCAGVACG